MPRIRYIIFFERSYILLSITENGAYAGGGGASGTHENEVTG